MICPSCKAENRPGAWGCRQCQKALPTLAPGDVVGQRFEIVSLLGSGGMGVVFKARDRTLDETVALKTLRADLDGRDDLADRFRSEIRLARRVSSPHVCRIHEYGVDGNLHFISMEHVDGVTLKDLLRESGGLPIDVALHVAAQVAVGLTAIHDAGIMHRDMKTANLMRMRNGLVKLMDFGIAKQLGGVTLTAAGQAVGTPEYMSPEQVTGQKVDLRTDLYSAGIVVFELLTGISPFQAATPLGSAHKQVTEMPDFQAAGIPATLEPVLRRALAKNRDERFSSAREMGEALTRARLDLDPPPVPSPREAGSAASAHEAPARAAQPTTGRRPSTAQSLAMAPPEVSALVEASRGPDPVARRRAVLALAELAPRSAAAVRALADVLKDPDPRARFMAAAALGRIGPLAEPAVPALLEALDDEAAGGQAAESLTRIGRIAVPALLEAMESGHAAIRRHAAATLTRIGARQ
jgi:eukaryotic-like serine/threonine-protein kinase